MLTLLLLQLSAQCDVNCVKVNMGKSFIRLGSHMEAGNGGCKCHINVSLDRRAPDGTNNSLAPRS